MAQKEVIDILYYFTYKDYIECIHKIKQKEYFYIKESKEKYLLEQNSYLKIQYEKFIENLFKDKERISNLLNCFLNSHKNVIKENLTCIEYKKEETYIKIVYKNLKKQIFYIIRYQEDICLNLPYEILKECIKIIQNDKKETMKKVMIIPIVIYIKDETYNYHKKSKQCFEIATYDNNVLELKYNLINLVKSLNKQKIKNTMLEELVYLEKLK